MLKIAVIVLVLTIACFMIGFICGKLTGTGRCRATGDDDLPIAHVGYTDAECGREK